VRFDAIVRDVAWSPDEKYLALGTYDGRIEVWDAASNQRLWSQQIDRMPVWSLAFAATQVVAVTGSQAEPGCGGKVIFLDADTGDTQHVDVLDDTPNCLAIDAIGHHAFTGCSYGGLITVFDIAKHTRVDQFGWRKGVVGDPRDDGVIDLAITGDGRLLVVVGYNGMSVWDVESRRKTHDLTARNLIFFSPQFLPGSKSFIASFATAFVDRPRESDEIHIGIWRIEGSVLRKEADEIVGNAAFALLPDRRGVLFPMKNGIRRVPLPNSEPGR
jgi:hypothetical protein